MIHKPALSQSDVETILAQALTSARAHSWNVTICICDDGGHPLGLLRMDGASPFSAAMAPQKARTAAICRRDSKHYEATAQARPGFLSAPLQGMVEGGVAILAKGQCLGAVGVSGAASAEDAQVAREAIDAWLAGLPE